MVVYVTIFGQQVQGGHILWSGGSQTQDKPFTHLILPCRLSLLKLLAYVGTTVNGKRLGLVRTLSKESSSSSITPGPGNIFRLEWIRRISSVLYFGILGSWWWLTRAGFVVLQGDDSEPDEYSVEGDSSFIESTHNFTSMMIITLLVALMVG